MIEFAVIMSVYHRDVPEHFREAVDSILHQTLPPKEIIIIVDGDIGNELQAALHNISSLKSIRILRNRNNQGAGSSRHLGISETKCEIVAIMDADDICLPNRFERQLPILENGKSDLVGAWVEEFEDNPGDLERVRRVPITHEEIFEYGKWRQPANHVTAMFRKEAYYKAGGYQPIHYVEDWDMIVRMLRKGIRFYNVPEVLVYVRCGKAMLKRRSGISYLAAELRLFYRMYLSGYLKLSQFCGNVIVRLVSRLLPKWILAIVYAKGLRHSNREFTR